MPEPVAPLGRFLDMKKILTAALLAAAAWVWHTEKRLSAVEWRLHYRFGEPTAVEQQAREAQ